MKQTETLNGWIATDLDGGCYFYDNKPEIDLIYVGGFKKGSKGKLSFKIESFIKGFKAPPPMTDPQECRLTITFETEQPEIQDTEFARLMKEIKELKERIDVFEAELQKPFDYLKKEEQDLLAGQVVRLLHTGKQTTIKRVVTLNERKYYVLNGYNGRYKRESFIIIELEK